jgi:chorismate mutase
MTSSHRTPDRSTDVERATARITTLRASIDRVDEMLVALVGERQRLARAVGAAKRAAGLAPVDDAREQAVIRHIASLAADHGVSGEDASALADQLIRSACAAQGSPRLSPRAAAA